MTIEPDINLDVPLLTNVVARQPQGSDMDYRAQIDELKAKIKQAEIDDRIKTYFVSKQARNKVYGTAVGLMFVSFLIGTWVG